MQYPDRKQTCCFSGYRPEKMPKLEIFSTYIPDLLYNSLTQSIQHAYSQGYRCFLTGMSRGFDLWAAEAVLILQREIPISLIAVLPFQEQARGWSNDWQKLHLHVLQHATRVYHLSPIYSNGCFHKRNRFLVDASSHLICYHDGLTGGTKYTIQYAHSQGLTIHNIANKQISFFPS